MTKKLNVKKSFSVNFTIFTHYGIFLTVTFKILKISKSELAQYRANQWRSQKLCIERAKSYRPL